MEANLTRNDALIEDGYDYTEEQAKDDLAKVHNVYRDTLNALTKSCIANHIMLSQHEIEVVMEGVGEALSNEADRALEFLPNESYTPADSKKLVAKAHVTIVDGLRVHPLDWAGAFEAMFRPQPNRGTAPQNPDPLAAKEEGV